MSSSLEPRRTASAGAPTAGSGLWQLRLTAVGIVALGALLLWQATTIRESAAYAAVGPRLIPLVVGGGLLVTGVLFLLSATLVPDAYLIARARTEAALTHWPTPALLGGLLLGFALLLHVLGYIITTALFVPLGARVLGSRAVRRDAITGVVIAVLLYVTFSGYLGIRLPDGPLAPLINLVG